MQATLVLALAMSAVTAERVTKVNSVQPAPMIVADAEAMNYGYGANDCASCRGHNGGTLARWCAACSPCNMYPNVHYFPDSHGYYYFRPYNYTHIALHQSFVQSYGGDPRNPYANDVFQGVYQKVEAQFNEEVVPGPVAPPVPPAPVIELAPPQPEVGTEDAEASVQRQGLRFITPVTRRKPVAKAY